MGGIERAIEEFMKKRRYEFVRETFCQLLKPIEGARFVEPHLPCMGSATSSSRQEIFPNVLLSSRYLSQKHSGSFLFSHLFPFVC